MDHTAEPTCCSAPSLPDMPSEILWVIARHLMAGASTDGFVDAWCLATTCRALSVALLDDDDMWKSHVRRSFGGPFYHMHTDPHAFGERWMRVYARLTRLTCTGDVPTRVDTGIEYEPTRLHRYRDAAHCDAVYESASTTHNSLACGRIVNGKLVGYGVLCIAQHSTKEDETYRWKLPLSPPVVILEGTFRNDRLHGRGTLHRRGASFWSQRPNSARDYALDEPFGNTALCRCADCMGDLFVRKPQGRVHAPVCHCTATWCEKCRLDGCLQKCTDPSRACDSCTAYLHARVSGHFLAHLDAFDGIWSDGLPQGDAEARFDCGTVFKGSWHKGLPHGPGLVNGVERHWFMGVLLPRARIEYPAGSCTVAVYEGDVKPRGLSIGCLVQTGTVPYFGNTLVGHSASCQPAAPSLPLVSQRQNVRHGRGRMRYASGAVFDGDWIDDVRQRGRMLCTDGHVFDGVWMADGGGSGTVTWPDGRVDVDVVWDAAGRLKQRHSSAVDAKPPAGYSRHNDHGEPVRRL